LVSNGHVFTDSRIEDGEIEFVSGSSIRQKFNESDPSTKIGNGVRGSIDPDLAFATIIGGVADSIAHHLLAHVHDIATQQELEQLMRTTWKEQNSWKRVRSEAISNRCVKYGGETGITECVIVRVVKGKVYVKAEKPYGIFALEGDSGSLVIESSSMKLVGVLSKRVRFEGSDEDYYEVHLADAWESRDKTLFKEEK
jgi:hypothetical protein